MGRYYNTGWTVADTNIVVTIARRVYPACPVDKYTLRRFVKWAKREGPETITDDELTFFRSLPVGD